ncbi:NADH-quinone oxidoreductase subunit NuoH [Aestuariimicrobium ganziense]|uniref:NADH-quinone oxidoreductase subunit NuoH n=1 Tax=Aestuariimicrobium ganziense TaxID=2773677 RepID=UPI001941DF44|nr:NADH-quinone oxidoreductase subunit NuoH [Aestuariimicrobium ganziense]
MNPLENPIFGPDPWWIVLIKVVGLFVVLLLWTIFNVWYERRVVGKMQHRLGPIMNGPFGLFQALADGAKLIVKEDFRPAKTDKWVFNLAPFLTGVAAFTAWAVIPFGGEVTMFGHRTRLQLTDLPVATLFVLAIASIGIYGIVLAGWASNSVYSLLGGIRSTAQMISYEITMGLALVAVFMYSSTMSTSGIVESQANAWSIGPVEIPQWYAVLLFPSFVMYVISMVGETNRAPFDLPECESELVSGYLTEYSGFRYALYFLSEYINMVTVSAVATTLFLGGYRAPFPFNNIEFLDSGWFGPIWFMLKVQLLFTGFVWLRGTLPRMRYDQFMHLGWKWLIEISLVWILLVALLKVNQREGWVSQGVVLGIGAVIILAAAAYLFFGGRPDDRTPGKLEVPDGDFDAFAGGYPVPPLPGQTLPEMAGVVHSTAQPLDEESSVTKGDES